MKMNSPVDPSLLRRLYPNIFAFAAGDPPQRGGSRQEFDDLCVERKTLLLPPPYTFTLSRFPVSRLSDTFRETFDFTQGPDLQQQAKALGDPSYERRHPQ